MNVADGAIKNVTADLEGDFRFPRWSPTDSSILVRNGVSKVAEGDTAPTATANFKVYNLNDESFQDVEMFDEFT